MTTVDGEPDPLPEDRPGKTPHFTGSDAWLLCAIALMDKGNGADLVDVILSGDFLDHAIFSGPELRRGTAKLIFASHIRVENGRFYIAGDAEEFYRSLTSKHRPVYSIRTEFAKFLDALPYPAGDPREEDPVWHYPDWSDDVINRAYQEYLKRWKSSGANRKRRKGKMPD